VGFFIPPPPAAINKPRQMSKTASKPAEQRTRKSARSKVGPRMLGSEALVKSLEHEGVDTIFAYPGGIISGFGARMARGCTSGQGLSGGATLSVGSWAFLLAFFGAGYLLAYFVRRLWNN
jgi:hypothetical protein